MYNKYYFVTSEADYKNTLQILEKEKFLIDTQKSLPIFNTNMSIKSEIENERYLNYIKGNKNTPIFDTLVFITEKFLHQKFLIITDLIQHILKI